MEFLFSLPTRFISLCFLECVMSLAAFLLFATDKYKAKAKHWRVPEKTLLAIAFFFGGIGGVLGMHLFRHKTQHVKFRILVPLFAVMQIIGISAMLFI